MAEAVRKISPAKPRRTKPNRYVTYHNERPYSLRSYPVLANRCATWNTTPIVSAQQMTRLDPRRLDRASGSDRAGTASATPADAPPTTRRSSTTTAPKSARRPTRIPQASLSDFGQVCVPRNASTPCGRPILGILSNRCSVPLPRIWPWEAWMDEQGSRDGTDGAGGVRHRTTRGGDHDVGGAFVGGGVPVAATGGGVRPARGMAAVGLSHVRVLVELEVRARHPFRAGEVARRARARGAAARDRGVRGGDVELLEGAGDQPYRDARERRSAWSRSALHATAAHIESIVRAYRGVLSREEETARPRSRGARTGATASSGMTTTAR